MTETESTVANMNKYGGSFARCLANAWHTADPTNRQRLEATFAPEFAKYAVIREALRDQS